MMYGESLIYMYGRRNHLVYTLRTRCIQNTRRTLIGINTTKLQMRYVCASVCTFRRGCGLLEGNTETTGSDKQAPYIVYMHHTCTFTHNKRFNKGCLMYMLRS